jgi:hypothetical protein
MWSINPNGVEAGLAMVRFNPVGVGNAEYSRRTQGSRDDAATLGWRLTTPLALR